MISPLKLFLAWRGGRIERFCRSLERPSRTPSTTTIPEALDYKYADPPLFLSFDLLKKQSQGKLNDALKQCP